MEWTPGEEEEEEEDRVVRNELGVPLTPERQEPPKMYVAKHRFIRAATGIPALWAILSCLYESEPVDNKTDADPEPDTKTWTNVPLF